MHHLHCSYAPFIFYKIIVDIARGFSDVKKDSVCIIIFKNRYEPHFGKIRKIIK